MPLRVTPAVIIQDAELEERFVRASGPGGQNVNKVATAVQLRFDAAHSTAIDAATRARLDTIAGTRMTREGVLVIDAREHRTQAQNREAARLRLADLLREALKRPTRRRKTRPSGAAKQKRLDTKRRRAQVKERRGKIVGE